jgi:hypothetical protein
MGSPLRLRPSTSRSRPLPSSSAGLPGPVGPNRSPLELHLSLGVLAFCPASPSVATRRWLPVAGSSPEVLAPPALADRSVHRSRPCLSRCVPTSPFLTASPVCSALVPPEISPGGTHGVLRPAGSLPIHRRARRLRRPRPSWRCPRRVSPSRALWPKPPLRRGCAFRGLADEPTVTACFRFPFGRGSCPLLGLLCGTSLPSRPKPVGPFGPVTFPN